jgi:hypothetical protein
MNPGGRVRPITGDKKFYIGIYREKSFKIFSLGEYSPLGAFH